MIALLSEDGKLIKVLQQDAAEGTYGFHSQFGFISAQAAEERERSRKAQGLFSLPEAWVCRFQLSPSGVASITGCTIEPLEARQWKLVTGFGKFILSAGGNASLERVSAGLSPKNQAEEERRIALIGAALALVVGLVFIFAPKPEPVETAPPILEPVTVKITPERQRVVSVPAPDLQVPRELARKIQDSQAQRAVAQNLGFLGLLGRKNLTRALGGAPTALKDASPGAGAGGKQGSGGELLAGLGAGVKRTTVGNTGVAGLGGVGSKGAGGGAGGYGDSMIGSGGARALSAVALSKDMMLDGGLDRSVIQATIAKYISQVRACYEEGLRKTPGLMGQVSTAFEINGTGALNFARITRSTLGDPQVEQCIAGRMMSWKFPKPLGGGNVKVTYPFVLRPVGA